MKCQQGFKEIPWKMWMDVVDTNVKPEVWEDAKCRLRDTINRPALPGFPSPVLSSAWTRTGKKMLLWSSGKGQARKGKYGERWKALKPKPLPRAYIKVGCHPPPPPTTTTTTHPKVSLHLTNGQAVVRWGRWRLEEVCRVTMGHLRVTIGHLRVTVGHHRVTIGQPSLL